MIQVCEPLLDGNEEEYVRDCLSTNWISSGGKYISAFEEKFSEYCNMPYGVACSSCTTGLHLALVALGVGPGDEVLIPDFTLIASANMVMLSGARPVLVDSDPLTWCIDASQIESKITPKTKAIMAVHMYGHPCDMKAIMEIASRHHLHVIEDCAQAHGAEAYGKKAGSWGDISVFSFYGNKIITTGEGGMLLCRDKELDRRLRLLRDQGFQEPRFVHQVSGFNYRMTNIQAAIGLAQTEKIDEKVARKCWIGQMYNALLSGPKGLSLPYQAPWAKNVYWMYGIVIDNTEGGRRDRLMRQLKEKGIETRAFFYPMHLQPVFQYRKPNDPDTGGGYPVATRIGDRGFYLPSGLGLDKEKIEYIAGQLLECLR